MSFEDYQRQVEGWASQFEDKYWDVPWQLAQLQEEAGELAREISHHYGPKRKKDSEDTSSVGRELVDTLFPLICIANNLGIDIDKEWQQMMQERLHGRDADRFEKKED